MPDNFGVQKVSVYGSFGEFNVGGNSGGVAAKYLLTKIRPGADGTWETQLASHMLPWREVFSLENLTFDELLQRDLDDSRVAHDLIPYLLEDKGMSARFFPPILTVIAPRSENRSGIDDYYPSDDTDDSFGDLFEFSQVECDGKQSPLGKLSYNPQKCSFIIADGQHRAMAVLALHRQLTNGWKGSAFASFYSHIDVKPEDVRHLELPVCMVYFPELTESNTALKSQGIHLPKVCRELFIVVNRSAKAVSRSRELLLDDNDFAARLMRRTLSSLKERNEDNVGSARVYSFAYGDSDSDQG
ncbi:MAG: DNA sulfur modification protein DndB, partial [Pirellulales bacterium]